MSEARLNPEPWVYRIYCKAPDMRRYAPIGGNGTLAGNLIYALHFTESEGPKALLDLETNNPELKFKLKRI